MHLPGIGTYHPFSRPAIAPDPVSAKIKLHDTADSIAISSPPHGDPNAAPLIDLPIAQAFSFEARSQISHLGANSFHVHVMRIERVAELLPSF